MVDINWKRGPGNQNWNLYRDTCGISRNSKGVEFFQQNRKYWNYYNMIIVHVLYNSFDHMI